MAPRVIRPVRISEAGIATVQSIADRDGITWSEAARRMLAFASTTMPPGWGNRPAKAQ